MVMSLAEAKKKTDAKIKKNRKKYFGTKESGPPSSDKRLGKTIKNVGNKIKNFVSSASSEPKTFGQAFAAARKKLGAGKTFTYKGKKYTTNRADDKKKVNKPMYSNDTADKKNPRGPKVSVRQGTPDQKRGSKTQTAPAEKKSIFSKVKNEFGKMKSDFNKAVKETKRNFGPDRMKSANKKKLDSKGNYKGTNIKPTKLQLSRMKMAKGYSAGGTVFTGR